MTPANTMEILAGADVAITCRDSVRLEKKIPGAAPGLKLVAHAAGSVKPIISDEFIRRGIKPIFGSSCHYETREKREIRGKSNK